LKANLERVKAQQAIQDGNYDALDYEAVYKLWKMAFGDEKIARDAQARSLELYMEDRCNRAQRQQQQQQGRVKQSWY